MPLRDGVKNRAAVLVKAIRESWAPPEKWLQSQEAKQKVEREKERRENEAKQKAQERAQAHQQEQDEAERAARLDAAFEKLDAERQREVIEQATARLGVLGRMGKAQAALVAMRRSLVEELDQD